MGKQLLLTLQLALFTVLVITAAAHSAAAQDTRTIELSSASIYVDSVDTPEKAAQVKAMLYETLAIRDFDQKNGGKINYTFLDKPERQSVALEALRNAGYSVEQTYFKANMTVAIVPQESHVVDSKEAHPADTDGNGDVTEAEYRDYLKRQEK
ncbi:MAG: hypothetical protein ACOCZ8_02465 [Bacteroidota bacterium]